MGRARYNKWIPWARAVDRDRVDALMARFRLTDLASRQIGELSGGQKRRVFIARALAQEASILLMDEPFTGVDTTSEHDILATLDELSQQGITILTATHDLGRAARDFDRALLLKRRLLAYGKPEDTMTPDVLRQAYGGALSVFRRGDETIMIADNHGDGR